MLNILGNKITVITHLNLACLKVYNFVNLKYEQEGSCFQERTF